jgi:hypothetical protein
LNVVSEDDEIDSIGETHRRNEQSFVAAIPVS